MNISTNRRMNTDTYDPRFKETNPAIITIYRKFEKMERLLDNAADYYRDVEDGLNRTIACFRRYLEAGGFKLIDHHDTESPTRAIIGADGCYRGRRVFVNQDNVAIEWTFNEGWYCHSRSFEGKSRFEFKSPFDRLMCDDPTLRHRLDLVIDKMAKSRVLGAGKTHVPRSGYLKSRTVSDNPTPTCNVSNTPSLLSRVFGSRLDLPNTPSSVSPVKKTHKDQSASFLEGLAKNSLMFMIPVDIVCTQSHAFRLAATISIGKLFSERVLKEHNLKILQINWVSTTVDGVVSVKNEVLNEISIEDVVDGETRFVSRSGELSINKDDCNCQTSGWLADALNDTSKDVRANLLVKLFVDKT